jgi:8-oxo-dGTP pyrophosphatase MutT (NUDIX family)
MRHSELALILIRLRINGEPCHLLIKHKTWDDWTFVGGHVEPHEKNDWARAAVRECDEELTPLRFGHDFTLVPLLDQPLRWGPVPSRSAANEPTIYTAQLFALRFLRSPADCIGRLPPDEFRIVRETDLVNRREDPTAVTSRAIETVDPRALAWDATLSSLPIEIQSLHA